jgi:hypothetical protein
MTLNHLVCLVLTETRYTDMNAPIICSSIMTEREQHLETNVRTPCSQLETVFLCSAGSLCRMTQTGQPTRKSTPSTTYSTRTNLASARVHEPQPVHFGTTFFRGSRTIQVGLQTSAPVIHPHLTQAEPTPHLTSQLMGTGKKSAEAQIWSVIYCQG